MPGSAAAASSLDNLAGIGWLLGQRAAERRPQVVGVVGLRAHRGLVEALSSMVGGEVGDGVQELARVHGREPNPRPIAGSRIGYCYICWPSPTARLEQSTRMEPSAGNVTEQQPRIGRRGTLENPEVYENVPGHIIPILEREFDDFDTEAAQFLAGEIEETEFIGFRLKQGVYGQRQPDVQMIRVKLPFGGVTPEQMEAFADVIEKYAPLNKGHITTRQNIQIHHVPLPDAAELIRELGDAGLSIREGCGNTMRNVTGDPWAGISEGELFDPTPYAGAYVRYFVRHPTTQLMPRKVKTAFTATDEDRAITGIHDVAFIPRIKDGVRGFEMRVGGGTSIMPRVAPTLYEFVGADDGEYLRVTEAVLRIFDRQEWLRVNRARARIKVFVDKFGIDELRRQAEEELQGDWVDERDFTPDRCCSSTTRKANAPTPSPSAYEEQRVGGEVALVDPVRPRPSSTWRRTGSTPNLSTRTLRRARARLARRNSWRSKVRRHGLGSA